MQIVARITALLCFTWLGVWVLWGSTVVGYDWYLHEMASTFSSSHAKGALPLLVLALPILFAGVVASLCSIRQQGSPVQPTQSNYLELERRQQEQETANEDGAMFNPKAKTTKKYHALPHSYPSSIHRYVQGGGIFGGKSRGEMDERNLFLVFVLVPLSIFIATYIRRHLDGIRAERGTRNFDNGKRALNKTIADEANSFGFAAIITMNLLLIPVSRYSPLLSVIGWSHPRALIFHRWMGFLAVMGVLMHGFLHCYRWVTVQNLNLWYMITIPSDCWNDWHGYKGECKDCECKDHLQNLTGCMAGAVFAIVLLFSLPIVRRRFYSIFYGIHVLAVPLGLVIVVQHYNKAVFYIAGGVLYYLASSMPVFVETIRSSRERCVALVSAELVDCHNSSSSDRPCISLTLEASQMALGRYRAGQYIRLWAPEISRKTHPFTITPVYSTPMTSYEDNSNQMRVIFRQTGKFTKQLGHRLLDSDIPPVIQMDGFHGSPNQLDQLWRHDFGLVVAGGIGITPYLSLLRQVRNKRDEASTTRSIHLHWVCRDHALIDYVQREYLNALVGRTCMGQCAVHCTIHYTGWYTDLEFDGSGGSDSSKQCDSSVERKQDFRHAATAEPFEPSKFAMGSKSSYQGNLPMFLSFLLIGGFGLVLIWVFWATWENGPILVALPLVAFCVAVGVLVNRILPDHGDSFSAVVSIDEASSSELELTAKKSDEHESADDESDGCLQDVSSNLSPTRAPLSSDTTSSSSSSTTAATFVHVQEGRPHIPGLLSQASFETAQFPAVFVCGPTSLLQAVRGAVRRGGKCAGNYGCNCGRIAMYEEAFEQ